MSICIIDYGLGNISSIFNSIRHIKYDPIVSCKLDDIDSCSHIILPGVGSFKKAMELLNEKQLIPILEEQVIKKKKPILGICLGMQLFATYSKENGHSKGLNWISGGVEELDSNEKELPIPHIGWNEVIFNSRSNLFNEKKNKDFYFLHSYHFEVKNKDYITGVCHYGKNITAVIEKDNIFGTQFHPEKSHDSGIEVIKKFIKYKNYA